MNLIICIVIAFIGNCIVQASPVYLNSYNNPKEEDSPSPDLRQLGSDANSNNSPYNGEQDSAFDDNFEPLQRSSPLSDYNLQDHQPEVESRMLGDMGWWNQRPPQRPRWSGYHIYSRKISNPWLGGSGYMGPAPFERSFDNIANNQYGYGNYAEPQGYRLQRTAISFTPNLVKNYDTKEVDQPSSTWVQQ